MRGWARCTSGSCRRRSRHSGPGSGCPVTKSRSARSRSATTPSRKSATCGRGGATWTTSCTTGGGRASRYLASGVISGRPGPPPRGNRDLVRRGGLLVGLIGGIRLLGDFARFRCRLSRGRHHGLFLGLVGGRRGGEPPRLADDH